MCVKPVSPHPQACWTVGNSYLQCWPRPQQEMEANLGDGRAIHSGASFARLQYMYTYAWADTGWDRLLYNLDAHFEFIGQTHSSSTSQLSPNSSFSASSPNQSASYLSPERTYPSSTSLGASGSFNNSYDSGNKVSWTVGGSESVDGKIRNEPPSDSVTLQAGTTTV